ncbi:lars-2 [Cordylochernes scorpioides]|uniref:leucine--tRNA ligase n=1 Tax=Cordylochernes scorpioides TaxID=51811 RepID=A0ABY6KLC4_9ARAC|nr:lars-2 [Cordylochernes scorpioides]
MDTFVDSSWYFLRYLDPHNTSLPFDPQTALPVDVYIGGKEHAVLHLYFSRFFWRFLRSEGCLTAPEPFRRFVSMGMVLGQTYRDPDSGRYVPPAQVESDFKPIKDWVFIIWKTLEWLIQIRTGDSSIECKTPHSGETPELQGVPLPKQEFLHQQSHHQQLDTRQTDWTLLCSQNKKFVTPGIAKELPEYDSTLAAFLVSLYPLAPHLSSEMWTALQAVGLSDPHSWYHLLNKERIGELQVPCKDLLTLNKSEVLDKLLSQPEILEKLKAENADLNKMDYIVTPQIGADFLFSSPPVPKKKKKKKSPAAATSN